MNFQHTEDRRMLADSLNRFIDEQYGFEKRQSIAYSGKGYDQKIWSELANLGAMSALFTEDEGGFGGTGFDISVVFESLGRGLVVEPFLDALMVGKAIAKFGSDNQKNQFLNPLLEGEISAAFAHEEANTRYAPNYVETTATAQGDQFVINGTKCVVNFADQAEFLLVSARTSGAQSDKNGITVFLVPKSSAGLSIKHYKRFDGGQAAEVSLSGVTVAASHVLGQVDQGYAIIDYSIDLGILALCAESLGAMEVSKKVTLEYLQTRKQFGLPIGSFQALQHRMADLLLEVEQMRSAVINAAASLDDDEVTRQKMLSAAKCSAGKIGRLVAEESIQMHGGIGMTWEYSLSHYAKRIILIDHQLGDEDFHLERFIRLS